MGCNVHFCLANYKFWGPKLNSWLPEDAGLTARTPQQVENQRDSSQALGIQNKMKGEFHSIILFLMMNDM